MAISSAEIVFVNAATQQGMVDGAMNNLFADAQVNSGVSYGWVEVRNTNATLTLSAGKFWLGVDLGGATVSAAIADGGTVRANSYVYSPLPSVPGSFTIPTDFTSGITVPTLTAGTKVVFCLKRDTTSASPAYPETNRVGVQGTSPA